MTTQDVTNKLREDQPFVQDCTAREGRWESRPPVSGSHTREGKRALQQLTREPWGSGKWGDGAQARAIQDLDREGSGGRKRGWKEWSNVLAASTGRGAAGIPCALQPPWGRIMKPTRTADLPPHVAIIASGPHHFPLRTNGPSLGHSHPERSILRLQKPKLLISDPDPVQLLTGPI